MTITNNLTNPLARMLDNAFTKFDANKDGKLNAEEYRSFYESLSPALRWMRTTNCPSASRSIEAAWTAVRTAA